MIYGVYIISKSGGLIFNMDHNIPKIENEKTFSYPLDISLEYDFKKVSVAFGERDGICGRWWSTGGCSTLLITPPFQSATSCPLSTGSL